jgi:membrane fusion protein, multidrug efflux system
VPAPGKIARGILIPVVLAGVALLGGRWWVLGRFLERTDNAYVEADISVVAPRVSGHVQEILVTDNEPVRQGTELVRIDDRELQAQFAEARARLSARRAALEGLEREARLQSAQVSRVMAEVESSTAELDRTRLDLARYEELARARLISQQRLELARVEARKTHAAQTASLAALAVERRRAELVSARREEMRAQLREAEAAVVRADLDRESTVVRAPIDGVVGNRSVRVGQYVRTGTPMMAISPLRTTYVVANFKETQLERMRPGQSVAIEVDAYPDSRLAGVLESVAPAAGSRFALLPPQNATGNFTKIVQRIPVRILLPRDHELVGRIRPGMSVVAIVDTR